MKSLVLVFFMFSVFGFSQEQENSIYFPQEQLIHPECSSAIDKNACLESSIEKQVFKLLNKKEHLVTISSSKKDTLSTKFTIVVSKKGILHNEWSKVTINNQKKRIAIGDGLDEILNKLPQFKVLNRKKENLKSKHFLTFKYQIKRDNGSISLNLIPNKEKYSGGAILTMPQFLGCGNADNEQTRKCFNKKIQKHIAKNFQYPLEAVESNIQGRVEILFMINKYGNIEGIRTRGPHPSLKQEATRIIKLLPEFGPGTKNGKPAKVPFSVPINFKIQ